MGSNRKPRAIILYLSRIQDIPNLKRSLRLLDKHFNNKYHYPVLVFHEDFNYKIMRDLQNSTKSNIIFELVKFDFPKGVDRKSIPEITKTGHNIGYRHMCRFFSGVVFNHPGLKDYDYYWRLDTDSYILGEIKYDLFEEMQKNDYIYGYVDILPEEPIVVEGLWDLVKKYIKDNKIKPTFLHKFVKNGEWDLSYYYNNFEIVNMSFWRSKVFKKFFDCIDNSYGIYKYRWGDAPIRLLTVATFIPENKTHKFIDVPYKHQHVILGEIPPLTMLKLHCIAIGRPYYRFVKKLLSK